MRSKTGNIEITNIENITLEECEGEIKYWQDKLKLMRQDKVYNDDFPHNRRQIIERLKQLIKKQLPYLKMKKQNKFGFGSPVFVFEKGYCIDNEEFGQWTEVGGGGMRTTYKDGTIW